MDTTFLFVQSDVDTVHILTPVTHILESVLEAATKTMSFPIVQVRVR